MKYQYASIASLREYGLDKSKYPDELLRNLSRLYSDRVNRITGKVFTGTKKVIRVNPFNTLFKIPGAEIIKVNSIYAEYHDISRSLLEPSNYEVKDNNIVKLKNISIESIEALEIDHVVGNVEGQKEVIVELVSEIGSFESSAVLKDASQLEVRDILTFGNTVIIVNSIDYDSDIIEFDDVGNIPTISVGSKLNCYGQAPLQIEEAVKLFIKHHRKLHGSLGRLKSEKIGKYSYETTGTEGSITGISEIDSILSLFINDDFDILFL